MKCCCFSSAGLGLLLLLQCFLLLLLLSLRSLLSALRTTAEGERPLFNEEDMLPFSSKLSSFHLK